MTETFVEVIVTSHGGRQSVGPTEVSKSLCGPRTDARNFLRATACVPINYLSTSFGLVILTNIQVWPIYREDRTRPAHQIHHMVGTEEELLAKAFGVALRRLRNAAGKSQEALALEANIQRNFVSLMERGENQPSITTIGKLAFALHIRPSELVAAAEEFLQAAKPMPRERRSAKGPSVGSPPTAQIHARAATPRKSSKG